MSRHDTIFALSSGAGRAGIAVFRVSGPESLAIAQALGCGTLAPRRASLRAVHDPLTGSALDVSMVIAFVAPRSFTGEDVLELHVHGGLAVVRAMHKALASAGARQAEAGEFTRRAFENGKIDLTEVEGLADLIAADTEAQRALAFALARGGLSQRVQEWRAQLIEMMAMVEADVDFADDEDAPSLDSRSFLLLVSSLRAEISSALAAAERGRKTREGYLVVLAGAPNVGKSTLLNVLAGRDVAIVSPIAGTTRDALEVPLEIQGQSVILVDTAGLRQAADPIENLGLLRTRERLRQADLILWLRTGGEVDCEPLDTHDTSVLEVWTKSDLYDAPAGSLAISSRTGEGIARLITAIGERLQLAREGAEAPLVTHTRQIYLLEQISEELGRFRETDPIEIIAEQLRLASRALARLAGKVDVEDVLGEIFSRFCIGK